MTEYAMVPPDDEDARFSQWVADRLSWALNSPVFSGDQSRLIALTDEWRDDGTLTREDHGEVLLSIGVIDGAVVDVTQQRDQRSLPGPEDSDETSASNGKT